MPVRQPLLHAARPVHLLLAGLVLCLLAYLPGLGGGFVFDDYPNIVDNPGIHVDNARPSSWLSAAWASPASSFQRPLASLSFALNHLHTGLAPRPMKATNLAIHLANGVLLFLLLGGIARAARRNGGDSTQHTPGFDPAWIAAAVACLWLVHPINLTSVLYVVQRMESLAHFFVLLGLLAYVAARTAAVPLGRARVLLWLAVPACTALGMASKESAALLPVYALVLELCVFRFRGPLRGHLAAFYGVFLLLPAVAGALLVLPRYLAPEAFAFRGWTLGERLLSQPRALALYQWLILVPLPGQYGFYYDHFQASRGLLTPWTTLPALVLTLGMAAGGLLLRRARPLVALGLLWFLGAHLMTSSVFPLELVFEHRNYFASAGLLLALVAGLAGVPDRLRPLAAGVAVCLAVLSLYSLADRSREWSQPLRLAEAEAQRNPASPRAQYGFGRALAIAGLHSPDSPLVPRALEVMATAAALPGSSALPDVGLLVTASRTGRPLPDAWWAQLEDKIARRAWSPEDDSALATLLQCRLRGQCPFDDHRLHAVLAGAVARPDPSPSMLYTYAIFAHNVMDDPDLALRLATDAARAGEPRYQLNLVNYLLDLDQTEQARRELDQLRTRLRPGQFAAEVRSAELRMDETGPHRSSH